MRYSILTSIADSGEQVYIYRSEEGKEVPLNSLYSPSKEAERFISKFLGQKKIFCLIGLGNGAILKKWIENDSDFIHLYIIEPFRDLPIEEEINKIIQTNRNKITFEYYDENSSPLNFRIFLEEYFGVDVEVILHPHYDKTEALFLKDIVNKLINNIKVIRLNQNTEHSFQFDWIIEPLLNLEYIVNSNSIQELKDKFAGQKAVLVASGPSLKEHISTIKKLQKSAYIFAAGSAMNGLLHHGIQPDFVTSFDSSLTNYEAHFKGTSYSGPLIVGSIINSNILKHHKGPVILAVESIDNITLRVKKDVPLFPAVPSVAIFTLQVINYLGFNEIYLVGQDLALINGEYYAEGVKKHQGSQSQQITMYVENNIGEKVGTNHMLYAFLESFNSYIEGLDKSKVKIYNLSKYGAKIKGTTYLPADSINLEESRKEIMLNLKNNASSIAGLHFASEILKELKDFSDEIKKIKRKFRYINTSAISSRDMKKLLKIFNHIRSQPIFEEVIIHRISYFLSKMGNLFEYGLDKDSYTNEDLAVMVNEIQKLVNVTDNYLDILLKDEPFADLESLEPKGFFSQKKGLHPKL